MRNPAPRRPTGTRRIIRWFGLALIVVIVAGAALAITALRNKEIEDWRRNLKSISGMLADNTSQTMFSAFLVLDAITERVQQAGVIDQAQFRAELASPAVHKMLQEKVRGLPQLEVATLVAANGDNINFSRSHPPPPINLAERDYFKAHQANTKLGDFISTAVRNKANGKWTFFISRRLNNAQGQFMGLVLVGLSVEALTQAYDRQVNNLGEGTSITLYRGDLTALARAPRLDEVIGRVNATGSTHNNIAQQKADDAVVLVNTPRRSTGQNVLRLSAVHKLDRYPLIVALVVPDSIFLAAWQRNAVLIAGLGLLGIAFVLAGIAMIARSTRQRELSEHELRESETMFQTMVDGAAAWEYWLWVDGSQHYMTPSALQFTGYSVAEFERDPGLRSTIVHPDDRPLWDAYLAQLSADCDHLSGKPLDLRIVLKSGALRWVDHSCRPVFGPAGEPLGRRATVRDITDRKAAEQEIRQLAYFDVLTGLPNRRLFLDRLGQALSATQRDRDFGAVMMLDLDHFKRLNDTRGHDVGDRLLVEVGRRLAATVRERDTVSRLGGDEFAVLIAGLGSVEPHAARNAERVAEKIHTALNLPYALDGGEADHRSSPSIGMTLFSGHAPGLDVLMKQADVALYQAKDAGRNAIRFFNPTMQATIDQRIALEGALRVALAQRQFQLFYQPQVNAAGERTGAEALIRWIDPVRGMVAPIQFIPLAEETGLIVEIGQWVMDTACAQLGRWADDDQTRALQMSVNVSARQFHQPDFVERVKASLASSGANPKKLMLELTESIVLDRVGDVIARMQQLHALGVMFSLDDFGTGYSSLSYLKQLPLDEIKIDRSFVRDLVDDSNDAAIVQAILAMSRSLGLRVIAEGVETEAQRVFLRRNGCTAYQGYLFGRPEPIEAWNLVAA